MNIPVILVEALVFSVVMIGITFYACRQDSGLTFIDMPKALVTAIPKEGWENRKKARKAYLFVLILILGVFSALLYGTYRWSPLCHAEMFLHILIIFAVWNVLSYLVDCFFLSHSRPTYMVEDTQGESELRFHTHRLVASLGYGVVTALIIETIASILMVIF